MSQSCASDDFSLPSDGDGHEEHIGRQSLGLQRQKQVEFGYDKTHSTVGVLCLSNPLVSLSLSLSLILLFLSLILFYLSLSLSLLCKKNHSSNPCFFFVLFSLIPLPQESGILLEFKQWLPLAVGKRRMLAEATRKKALYYMAGITYLLDPTSVDESKVLDASNVESKLEELASNTGLGPSGFLARIDALIHFVRFLLYKAERAVSLPSCSSSSSSNVQTLQFVLGQYRCIRTNREKDRKRQDNFVREQEEEADLDNEAVTQIVTSPTICEKALCVTSQAKASGKRPSRNDSVFVTRYLFAVLIYRTPNVLEPS